VFTTTTIHTFTTRAGRAAQFVQTRPTLLGRILATVVAVAILAVLLVVLVPFALALLVLGTLLWLYVRISLLFRRAQAPNGMLDGRRNVRVVEPSSHNHTPS
jgi:heme A synthase